MKYDVFISYSSKDQKKVEEICGYLEAHGIKCFVAFRDIPRGVVWAGAIVDALEESSMMLVAFSESFNESKQVDREIELASMDDKPILTFRLDNVKFKGAKKYYLQNLNWIDGFPNTDSAYGELYSNICKLLGKEEVYEVNVSSSNSSGSHVQLERELPEVEKAQTQEKSPEIPFQEQNTSNSLESQMEFDPQTGEFKLKKDENHENSEQDLTYTPETPEWIDLGLPSGLKWAPCNVGALKPEEYGDYYQWGEIRTITSKNGSHGETSLRDKQWLLKNGYIEGRGRSRGTLTFSYDAARQKWGGAWRIPTLNEFKELIKYTTTEWETLNGVKGISVKSKRNGNSIFLPAAGYHSGSYINSKGSKGYYWSSTPDENDSYKAYELYFFTSYFETCGGSRRDGHSIRPVSD